MFDLRVKNGILVVSGEEIKTDLYVKKGVVSAISSEDLPAELIVDAEGKYVFPGFVDPHSHMNDPPGGDVSEDFYTGTCSAAAGGITTSIEMPLTTPVTATKKALIDKINICGKKAVVDFSMICGYTPDNGDEIEPMLSAGAVGFKAFTPYSTEIKRLDDADLYKALSRLSGTGVTLSIHCENADIVKKFTDELRENGKVSPEYYGQGRPEIAEIESVMKVSLMAYKTGAKVNIAHCSSPEAVDIASYYRQLGADISVETCTHYLALNDKDIEKWGVYCVCNPPLRSEKTRNELWKRVVEGKIDFIGSDHSAYLHSEKAEGKDDIFLTPAGITALQTCYPIFFDEAVNKRGMPVARFCEMTSASAAKRFDIYPRKGSLMVGSDADFVIFDAGKKWKVRSDDFFYLEKWTPHEGQTVTGSVERTFVRGQEVFSSGKIVVKAGSGQFIARN
ncbi:MAG: allantoinase AllB [Ruminococcaceae bacterium]|nr:allantoinase AllB [Oscillospiraceae bacterium]